MRKGAELGTIRSTEHIPYTGAPRTKPRCKQECIAFGMELVRRGADELQRHVCWMKHTAYPSVPGQHGMTSGKPPHQHNRHSAGRMNLSNGTICRMHTDSLSSSAFSFFIFLSPFLPNVGFARWRMGVSEVWMCDGILPVGREWGSHRRHAEEPRCCILSSWILGVLISVMRPDWDMSHVGKVFLARDGRA
ncbi:hypothetical protein CC78DRAFT_380046 [Lojkania enalia]|uniref:Uncharacterized protein n=1 Tax=Lojkania enalia TaxID=147567 RepID=A0A9P4N0X2_9PLEO|nr:hypothetical protein CC78DRAFT_380046 [Didymosphaeria enalia]